MKTLKNADDFITEDDVLIVLKAEDRNWTLGNLAKKLVVKINVVSHHLAALLKKGLIVEIYELNRTHYRSSMYRQQPSAASTPFAMKPMSYKVTAVGNREGCEIYRGWPSVYFKGEKK